MTGQISIPDDSTGWSKKFEVLAISRLMLHSLGIPYDRVAHLTDEDMERIADDVSNGMSLGFEEDVKFAASIVLAEKDPTGGKT